jgi:outer membrane lipoprotein SlyB
MPCKILTAAIAAVLVGFVGQSHAQSHARDGATVGGLTGAVIGGIIGHQNDETPEGILIGGAVGAIAGGLIGDAHDQQMAREHAYRQQLWQQQQAYQAYRQPTRRAVSNADVVQMTRNGLSQSVIINHIQSNGIERRLDVNDIISLHQQGVGEPVITAMQRAPVRTPLPAPPTVLEYRPPVIVSEHCPHHHAPLYYEAVPVVPYSAYWR